MKIKKQTLHFFGMSFIVLINWYFDDYNGGYLLKPKWQLFIGLLFFAVGVFDLFNKKNQ